MREGYFTKSTAVLLHSKLTVSIRYYSLGPLISGHWHRITYARILLGTIPVRDNGQWELSQGQLEVPLTALQSKECPARSLGSP